MKEEVCVKIEGMNLTRIIDKLVAKNILIKDLKTNSKHVRFVIANKDLDELNKICKVEHKFYSIISKNGFKQILHKLPYLFGSFLAITIIFAYLFSINFYIYKVDVSYSSNTEYNIENVNQFLADNGIVVGMKRNKFSIREIQELILLNFDDISGCSVKRNGGDLDIIIYPATKNVETNQNILSKYDAVVTNIKVFAGEANVKEGDIVKANDILIKNTNGASGIVEGKIYYSASIIYNENQQYLERTGNFFKAKNVVLFNNFSLNKRNMSKFDCYETEICDFYLFEQYLFPIKIQEVIYYELAVKERIVPYKDVENKILKDAYNEALSKVKDVSKISNVTYSVVTENNYTRVDCFIETIDNLF